LESNILSTVDLPQFSKWAMCSAKNLQSFTNLTLFSPYELSQM